MRLNIILLVLLCSPVAVVFGQNSGGNTPTTAVPTPPPGSPTDAPTTTTQTTTATPTAPPTGAPTVAPVPPGGTTEINIDFKGILAGAQGGDCDCSKQTQCDQCAFGVFGYPCIPDHCDQCTCGGGNASPPGSACLPCTSGDTCGDGSPTSTSTCLNNAVGPCEPDFQTREKRLYVGSGLGAETQLYVELDFYTAGPLCYWHVNWASTAPISSLRVYAMDTQFRTGFSEATTCRIDDSCRITSTDQNCVVSSDSLALDTLWSYSVPGFSTPTPGLIYGAGPDSMGRELVWGASNTASLQGVNPGSGDDGLPCPVGINANNLPRSVKVVIDGTNVPIELDNVGADSPPQANPVNKGKHYVMNPDLGLCSTDENAGNYRIFDQSSPAGRFSNNRRRSQEKKRQSSESCSTCYPERANAGGN